MIEEIVGVIEDEFDPRADDLITLGPDGVVLKGVSPLHLVTDELGIAFEDPDEATIGGHVLEVLGRLPEPGEEVDVDGQRFEVRAVEDARIVELFVRATGDPGRGDGG